MKQPLSQKTYEKFQKLIYAYLGLYFPVNKKYLLENSLQARLEASGCQTFEDYFQFLRFSPDRELEYTQLTNCLTTNETFFFRDAAQLDCLQSYLLPEIVARREKQKSLRIWSAGCSSGEEAYTLAMLLEEDFQKISTWNVEIFGTDVNEHVVAKAKVGRYDNYAVRNISEPLLKKYFTLTDGQHEVHARLRKWVKFSMLNLFDLNQMSSINNVDLVLCRNVLIYFDDPGRIQIVKGFHDALRAHGVLMIGFSETLRHITGQFRSMPWKSTIIYQKEEVQSRRENTSHAQHLIREQRP